MQTRILSGRIPLLYRLGFRGATLGLLGRKSPSGGVMGCAGLTGVGAFVLDRVFGPLVCCSLLGGSGGVGAHDALLAERALIFSISTLRNGSGSFGSMTS